MSILIDRNTRVMTQGITGKTGAFHTRLCRDYANGRASFVAGVNPNKAGENFEGAFSRPASTAASGSVTFCAGLPKNRSAAASTPYAPLPKYTRLR